MGFIILLFLVYNLAESSSLGIRAYAGSVWTTAMIALAIVFLVVGVALGPFKK